MAKKVLSAILTLKDQSFSTNIKKASKGVGSFDKKLKYSSNQVKKFGQSATSTFSKVAKGAAGLAAAYVGFQSASQFMSSSVEAAKAQIDAETKLQAVMKNTKGVTDAQIQSIKEYASAQQNLGVIGDEVQLSGVQQLATYQLQSDTLKKLMPGMNDLLAQQKGLNATQGDAVNIGNMVGKVMAGQVGALSRAGINFSKAQEQVLKFGNEQEKAAVLAEVLEQNVGGVNKALLDTDQGKIQSMTNAWGDYKEEVGKKILPLQGRFAGWFVKHIPKIQSGVLGFIDKGVAGFNKVQEIGQGAFNLIRTAINNNRPVIDYVKSGVESIGENAIKVKEWTVEAFQNIKNKIAENRPTIDGVTSVINDLGVKALSLKDWLGGAFEKAKPGISWLKDEGLPLVVDGIAGVIDKSTDVYNIINDNWNGISPIVYGVAGAILFYKTAIGIAAVATKTWTVITGALTVAKAGLNAVLAISPLGWIAIGIGAVIAVGVLLYKNFDTIKERASQLWQRLLDNPLLALVGGPIGALIAAGITIYKNFDTIKERAGSFFGMLGGWVDSAVQKWNNFKESITSFKMPKIGLPKWMGGNGLIQGSYAVGTNRVPRDMVAQIHKDEMIIPARQSERLRQQGVTIDNIADMPSSKEQTTMITRTENKTDRSNKQNKTIINVYAKGTTAKEVIDEVVPQLKLVLDNI